MKVIEGACVTGIFCVKNVVAPAFNEFCEFLLVVEVIIGFAGVPIGHEIAQSLFEVSVEANCCHEVSDVSASVRAVIVPSICVFVEVEGVFAAS